jgi:hypothetical protein
MQPADVELFGDDRAARTLELELKFSGHAPVDPYRLELDLVEVQLPESRPPCASEPATAGRTDALPGKPVAFVKSASGR